MPDRPQVQKATIYKLRPNGSVDESAKVVCHFNPKDLNITSQVRWVKRTSIGEDTPAYSFAGGGEQTLTLPELLFDSTDTGNDVRDSYNLLLEIASVKQGEENTTTGRAEPPTCQFQWGKMLSFNAVITEITQNFTMFKADGTPLRAKVKVTFAKIRSVTPGQNPTSRSEPRKTWVVREGERLDWIAYREYGDTAQWRHIAETNGLDDPSALYPGQVLKLAPLP